MFPRLRFYWVVAACGGVLMALEILSSRLLAPYYGNSVYVWGSIISVFLAALSLGYLWGGRLADSQPSMAALGRMVALAAACEAVLLLAGPRLAGVLAGWTGGSPAGTLLAASVLFGPASVLLATVSPWAVRLAARDLGHLGGTAGRLFALSTLGSLAGTLACTFLLIPFLLVQPEVRRALMIGMGGGTIGPYLQARIPDLRVDYVDIDPAVPEIARRFFGFQPGPRMTVAVADGRRFLQGSRETWDLIYGDAYIGQSVPFHLTTVQFLDEARRHLAPGGVFALNLAHGLSDPFSQAMYRTVRERFGTVYLFLVRHAANALVIATPETGTLSTAELVRRGRELDARMRFDPPLATLASWRGEVALDVTEIPVLTDELAPVDRLIRLGEETRVPGRPSLP